MELQAGAQVVFERGNRDDRITVLKSSLKALPTESTV